MSAMSSKDVKSNGKVAKSKGTGTGTGTTGSAVLSKEAKKKEMGKSVGVLLDKMTEICKSTLEPARTLPISKR